MHDTRPLVRRGQPLAVTAGAGLRALHALGAAATRALDRLNGSAAARMVHASDLAQLRRAMRDWDDADLAVSQVYELAGVRSVRWERL